MPDDKPAPRASDEDRERTAELLRLISILGGVEVRRGRKLTRSERRALKRSAGAP